MDVWFHICELNGLQVTPITTFLLVLLAMTPCLVKAFSNPQPKHIIRWVSYACTCGFIFGWHVHEKASLHFTIPLALIAMDSLNDARHYFLLSIGMFCSWLYFNIYSVPLATFPEKKNLVPSLSMKKNILLQYSPPQYLQYYPYYRVCYNLNTDHFVKQIMSAVSCYSLFPLLFEKQEYLIKVMLLLTYAALMWVGFTSHFAANSDQEGKKVNRSGSTVKKNGFIGWIGLSYLLGIAAIELWSRVLHHHVFGDRLPFLPLIMVSFYCGVGMMYSWMWQLIYIVRHTWYNWWYIETFTCLSLVETNWDDMLPGLMHLTNIVRTGTAFL